MHVPMIVHWPAGIPAEERGTLRDQFTFVSDIAPTVYELVGVQAPEVRAASSSSRSPGTPSPPR